VVQGELPSFAPDNFTFWANKPVTKNKQVNNSPKLLFIRVCVIGYDQIQLDSV
jgi:hypothetical protein